MAVTKMDARRTHRQPSARSPGAAAPWPQRKVAGPETDKQYYLKKEQQINLIKILPLQVKKIHKRFKSQHPKPWLEFRIFTICKEKV